MVNFIVSFAIVWMPLVHCCTINPQSKINGNLSTLKLLHVFLRHGDRTPFHLYPNDPYTSSDFYPTGLGELTNAGKNRIYNIGLALREAYGEFLGGMYSSDIVKAISSPFSRCTDSLVVLLTALFPPVGMKNWRFGENWQPFSYEYNDIDDKLFLVYKHCPNFKIFQDKHLNTKENTEAFEPFEDIIAYIRHKTGDYKGKYVFAYSIYTTLLSEMECGLPLPDWAATIFPDTFIEIAKVEVDQMYRGDNKILGAGYFMAKLVNDTILTLENEISVENRKLYIYSGHDMNIISILSWLDVLQPHLPNYGAYITFEIHVIEDQPYIKILYENFEAGRPQEIDIQDCGVMCPFITFLDIFKPRLNPAELCGL